MKTFKKVVATGAIFNGLATVAKSALNVGMKTEAITACLNMDTLKVFGTSFVTSTLPAVLVNAMDNFVIQNLTSNGLLQQGAIVAESVAFSHVTSIVADKNVLQFTKPDFTKLTNFDHLKVLNANDYYIPTGFNCNNINTHKDFLVDTANTFLQAEVMKYLDVFGGDEVLNPEFA
jgi:hypothetical protein